MNVILTYVLSFGAVGSLFRSNTTEIVYLVSNWLDSRSWYSYLALGWAVRFRISAGKSDLYLLQPSGPWTKTSQLSNTKGTLCPCSKVMRSGCDVNHSFASSHEVKMEQRYIPTVKVYVVTVTPRTTLPLG